MGGMKLRLPHAMRLYRGFSGPLFAAEQSFDPVISDGTCLKAKVESRKAKGP